LVCPAGTHGVPAALEILRRAKIPTYNFPEEAALALAKAVRYGQWLERPIGEVPAFAEIDPAPARSLLQGREAGWLSADEVRILLDTYGIRTPRSQVVRSIAEAEEAARSIGGPVAVKLVSREIQHK